MNNIFYSPLRYPGGKNRLSKFIARVCKDNEINGHYIEPFAGGASVALHLMVNNVVNRITINDYDKAIYAFWYSVINNAEDLCELIMDRPVNLEAWHKCKNIIDKKSEVFDLLELGYATLFLNRTNYSGVIKGGIIGGKAQSGRYKIDCRFNKDSIVEKIRKIGLYKDRITVMNMDAMKLINEIRCNDNTLFYFDPPYYNKGKCLYMNYFRHKDHRDLSRAIRGISKSKWIVSYDDTPEIVDIYRDVNRLSYSLSHNVNHPRMGKEVIFYSSNLFIGESKHPVTDYEELANQKRKTTGVPVADPGALGNHLENSGFPNFVEVV